MELDEIKNEATVVAVKPEEIENLEELGFKDEEDLMVFETETGVVGVDKETGIVAAESDGASVEEIAIVSELVSSGIADITTADESGIEDVEDVVDEIDDTSDEEESEGDEE